MPGDGARLYGGGAPPVPQSREPEAAPEVPGLGTTDRKSVV